MTVCIASGFESYYETTSVFFLLIVTSYAIADDTPSSYQQAPAWLTDTRKAIESKDFDTARRILNENSEQKKFCRLE